MRAIISFLLAGVLLSGLPALTQRISIAVQNASGDRTASTSSTGSSTVSLRYQRQYQPGDRIVVTGDAQWLMLRLSDAVAPCSIYLSPAAHHRFEFPIPFGTGEQMAGSAYAPDAFTGTSHVLSAAPLSRRDRKLRRNLALNPCDRRTDAPVVFPHASSNSVSRNAYNFDARNAIDGVSQNGHHGEWPYQSWGPLMADDIWWKLDFGREVELDTIRLMLRTDFPHDSYWKTAVIEFSDGSSMGLKMSPSPEFQDFPLSARRVRWLKLTQLTPDENRWSGLIEVEAWGRDVP